MSGWRVVVDRDRCQGYANCLDAAPDVFDLDEHDIAVVLTERFDDAEHDRLERAVRRCPVAALRLEPATDRPGTDGRPR
ncbi:MAG: ferredoxin [Acidimicrobiia bacterium]